MTVCIQNHNRCRICYALILRDRSKLFSSTCCQRYYHLFKYIQRTEIPIRKKFNSFKIKISNRRRTVCFRDLISKYLHAEINPIKNLSNFICSDCSRILLDIEQCAKYLRKTINHLKIKFNKSNQLLTSSLSALFQKKNQQINNVKNEPLPIMDSDDDEQFADIDDEEESDDEQDDIKPLVSTNITTSNRSKSPHFTSSFSSGGDSISNVLGSTLKNRNNNNGEYIDDDDDDDDDNDEEEDDEDGLIINSASKSRRSKQKHLPKFLHRHISSGFNSSSSPLTNPIDPTMHLPDETNPNMIQLRLAHMMAAAAAAASSTSSGQTNNNDGNTVDSMMNTVVNMQRNFLLKILSDPMAAAQAAQVAAASATQIKANISSISLMASHNKQSGSGRKRKSTPEKRVISNDRLSNNNGNTSPLIEHESINNSYDNINNQESTDHPLELTLKNLQRSNRVSSSTDVQNLVINTQTENGSSSTIGQFYQHIDEDYKESMTPNDSSLSLSPSLHRRSTSVAKRQRLSTSGPYDNLSMVNLPQTTTDLLSPNHHQTIINEDNNHQRRQQRKLDPRSCAECGKVLFSDKTHLLHCQTHAKNAKQCWICGVNDNDIKKHIVNEHGNQKFTNTGFKCQHCDKVFPLFPDLETHNREHSKKKPFECPICNKRFGQQGNLSCHLRIHSGVKPFTCASCGKAFRHSNSLRRHARTVHSASRGLATTTNSFLLAGTETSSPNDIKSEAFDDVSSALMIPSDDNSSSTGGVPSPSISNAQLDSDSHEQFGTS